MSDESVAKFLRRLEDAKKQALRSGVPPWEVEAKAKVDLDYYVQAHNAQLREAAKEQEPEHWRSDARPNWTDAYRNSVILVLEN